ncbi:transposase [Streptacidiphilus sp. MAP12-20]|uniref:transposase n=1 Tax=Streptacidiphilus sp. MAP12-20 TaxID=3156299 RepID=UPI00351465A5
MQTVAPIAQTHRGKRVARPSQGTLPADLGRRFAWLAPTQVWPVARHLLPAPAPRPQGGGTRRHDEEALFAAVVFILVSNSPWRGLPSGFGVSWQHTHRCFLHWTETGAWERLESAARQDHLPPQLRFWAHTIAHCAQTRRGAPRPSDRDGAVPVVGTGRTAEPRGSAVARPQLHPSRVGELQ